MAGKTEAGGVRDFERGDIQSVAGLFQRTFRRSKAPSPSLAAYLEQAFFNHPWAEPDIRSKVFVEPEGRVSGFLGVLPARLELDGRILRAAFASSLMVENPKENPLAGARLVRAFLSGPQDVSFTETANRTALGMWQKAGHPFDPSYSLNWLRVLRPVSTGVQLLERRFGPARLLRPFGRIADRLAGLAGKASFRPDRVGRLVFRDVSLDDFGMAMLALKGFYPMRPCWDADNIGWFLEQAEQKRNFGYPEWRVGYAADGRPLAAYVYFSEPGGIGWVLQAVAAPAMIDDLVDDLFNHAYKLGCAGLRGTAHPWLIPALLPRRTLFHSRSFYIAHAREKALLEPVRAGKALISGLAGEGWTRLIGDRFD